MSYDWNKGGFIHEKMGEGNRSRPCIDGFIHENAYAIDTTTVNEKWGKPTVVYGGGLSEAQIQQTSQLLGIKDPKYRINGNSNRTRFN